VCVVCVLCVCVVCVCVCVYHVSMVVAVDITWPLVWFVDIVLKVTALAVDTCVCMCMVLCVKCAYRFYSSHRCYVCVCVYCVFILFCQFCVPCAPCVYQFGVVVCVVDITRPQCWYVDIVFKYAALAVVICVFCGCLCMVLRVLCVPFAHRFCVDKCRGHHLPSGLSNRRCLQVHIDCYPRVCMCVCYKA